MTRCTFAGSDYFKRMQEKGLYSIDTEEIARRVKRYDMENIYEDSGLNYFKDQDYEQIPLSQEQLGDALKFVKENMSVTILSYKGNVFAVEHSINKNGGKYDIYLDDELVAQKSTYYGGFDGNQLAMEYYDFDLEYGNHKVKIVTTEEDKQVMIFHFIVGEK